MLDMISCIILIIYWHVSVTVEILLDNFLEYQEWALATALHFYISCHIYAALFPCISYSPSCRVAVTASWYCCAIYTSFCGSSCCTSEHSWVSRTYKCLLCWWLFNQRSSWCVDQNLNLANSESTAECRKHFIIHISCGWWMPLGTGVQVPTDSQKSEIQHLLYCKTTDNVEEKETYIFLYTRIANCSLVSHFINTKRLSAIF
jgi:hypothetical protein